MLVNDDLLTKLHKIFFQFSLEIYGNELIGYYVQQMDLHQIFHFHYESQSYSYNPNINNIFNNFINTDLSFNLFLIYIYNSNHYNFLTIIIICIIRQISAMEIEFIVEDDKSVQQLIVQYIEYKGQKGKQNKQTVLVNSILLKINQNINNPLQMLFNNVTLLSQEQNIKSIHDRVAQLLEQILTKDKQIVQKAQPQIIILLAQYSIDRVFSGGCSDQYINILNIISPYLNNKSILLNIFTNPKMHPLSYKHITRNRLYTLLLTSLPQKNPPTKYISLIINSISEEKDPRNMLLIFDLYLYILNNYQKSTIDEFKQIIFESLQGYYPIDFVGDADNFEQAKLQAIADKLDECLTTQGLIKQTQRMMLIKMSAPTSCVAYIKTLTLIMQNKKNQLILDPSWMSLLHRLTNQQFLQEQGSNQQLSYLSQLMLLIINNTIITKNEYFPTYQQNCMLKKWLDGLILPILTVQDWKYAGIGLSITKKIMMKSSLVLREVMGWYILSKFIKHHKANCPSLINQLGIVLTLKQVPQQFAKIQNFQLFFTSLGCIFEKGDRHIKIIVLRIIMLFCSKNQTIHQYCKNIHQTYIAHQCQQILIGQLEPQLIIQQAYIDYIVNVVSEIQSANLIINTKNPQAKIYGLMGIAGKPKRPKQIIENLIRQINRNDNGINKYIIKLLQRMENNQLKNIYYHLHNIQLEGQEQNQICNLLFTNKISQLLYRKVDDDDDFFIKEIQEKQTFTPWKLLVLHKFWINHFHNFSHIISPLIHQFPYNNTIILKILIQIYNQAIRLAKLNSFIPIQISPSQCFLIPVNKNQIQFNQSLIQIYSPTLIHYLWLNSPSPDLVNYLPDEMLIKYCGEILPTLFKSSNFILLNKITGFLSQSIVIKELIPFLIQLDLSINVNQAIAGLQSINKIIERAKVNKKPNVLMDVLVKNRQNYIRLLETGLLNRKRLIRQCCRMVLYKFQHLPEQPIQ